jgi:hypothetical protein
MPGRKYLLDERADGRWPTDLLVNDDAPSTSSGQALSPPKGGAP